MPFEPQDPSESPTKMNDSMTSAENISSDDSSKLLIEIEDDSNCTKSDVFAKPAKRNEFGCGVCSLEYQSFESLDEHYVEKHGYRVEHVCPKCNSGFHILQDYFEHRNSHDKKKVEEKVEVEDDKKEEEEDEEEDEMPKEGEESEGPEEAKKGEIKKRKATISIKPFKKQKIEKSFVAEKVEDRSRFSSKTYKCVDCDIPEMGCEAFEDHCKNEHGRVPCLECGQTFAQKSFLERHNWKHKGVKPYPCDKCDKAFTRKHALEQHKSKQHPIIDS